ncbi:MAG: hypothetical protein DRO40_07840 [Thermoprotei archaeon]|nr:MAG: hypothetical protein DRO40_07840 [Thermoprotei archaeon]
MSYRKGANFERRVKQYFERKGFYVVRSAGSHGTFDLLAVRQFTVLGIQCKIDGKLSTKEKKKMLEAYKKYGIVPILAYRDGKKLKLRYLTDQG